MKIAGFILSLLVCCSLLLLGGGCDDHRYDHKPPEGMGSLIVDNNTADDLSVFIDSQRQEDAGDGRKKAYDLNPGTYRVVVTQQGGDRTYGDFVDILEGARTILDVSIDLNNPVGYDVLVFVD